MAPYREVGAVVAAAPKQHDDRVPVAGLLDSLSDTSTDVAAEAAAMNIDMDWHWAIPVVPGWTHILSHLFAALGREGLVCA